MSQPIRILLFGAGERGARVYAEYALKHPDDIQFVAVAEPDPIRRERLAKAHHISPENQFEDWSDALKVGKIADAVINATPDEIHHNSAMAALNAGYDMLLEKPIATTLSETIHIIKTAEDLGRLLLVGHVLRYTDLFQEVKQIFDTGRLGQIINISHSENVSYFHMAHSYVRGNWRSTRDSAPMIIAKSCHDLDLVYWFLGEKCVQLSSMGDLLHFKAENAPKGAPARCTDGCPAAEECPFYAPRIYVDNYPIKAAVSKASNPLISMIGQLSIKAPRFLKTLSRIVTPLKALTEYSGWPRNYLTEQPESDQAVMDALHSGPYGRCVYHCDNDVVDHQVVNMIFESGITATLTMHGHGYEGGRTLRVDGSRATLLGKLSYSEAWLEVHDHASLNVERYIFASEVNQTSGHGGGDDGLMDSFVKAMLGEVEPLTSARDSLESHLMGFAAESARLGNKVVDMQVFSKKSFESG